MDRNRKNTILIVPLLLLGIAISNEDASAEQQPMTPEVAAKHEMVQRQKDKRVTDDQRKQAAERLKAERIKVYQAKEQVKKMNRETGAPSTTTP